MADAPEGGGGGFKGLFTEKIGPLPMIAWVGIIGGGLVAYRLYKNRQSNASTPSTATDSTPASDVPQFVNQTYTTVTAPQQSPPPPGPVQVGPIESFGPRPKPQPGPKPQRLQREWTAPAGGVSTLAQISQRLTGRSDAALLTPANATAKNFINGPYKRNKNAKVPKGATFTYLEGQVVNA